ncbi:MAG TPA: nucleoside-diphosphate kinase [Thermomicrobiaceae bacterium]|nr:nucleoside-diphosphate kinase [Thermomicrobiaceae bacterium]
MAGERTLIIVKPDAVQRGLIGEVLQRLERRGLKFVGLKLMLIPRELAERHYGEHKEKPFYPGLVGFITSGPVVAGVIEGPDAIAVTRATAGGTDPAKATNPATATPGSIRADFGLTIGQNIIHASDSATSAAREIALFFNQDELLDYQRAIDAWIVES